MKNSYKIYLAGAMSNLSMQDQNEWRIKVKKELESCVVKCINPVDYYNKN